MVMIKGKPFTTVVMRPFRNKADFVDQLIANRRDKSIPQREQVAREAKLIARRRRQLGED